MVLGDSQGWEATMNDIWRASRLESNVGVRQEGVPHFIMGHSMGGLLSLCFVIDYGRQLGGLAGCIASAPAVRPGFPVPWIKRTVGSLLAKVVGSMNISTELGTVVLKV
jgi:alpha-beta hydrolase superfamily lysophospholipase